jgi:hypothetical protein
MAEPISAKTPRRNVISRNKKPPPKIEAASFAEKMGGVLGRLLSFFYRGFL